VKGKYVATAIATAAGTNQIFTKNSVATAGLVSRPAGRLYEGGTMSEQLRAAIERAFIDLYYAAAELKLAEPDLDGAPAATEHVKLAIRALLGGLRSSRAEDAGAPPAGSMPN